jgi:hypothetical protein
VHFVVSEVDNVDTAVGGRAHVRRTVHHRAAVTVGAKRTQRTQVVRRQHLQPVVARVRYDYVAFRIHVHTLRSPECAVRVAFAPVELDIVRVRRHDRQTMVVEIAEMSELFALIHTAPQIKESTY